jgi:hypothetical protein
VLAARYPGELVATPRPEKNDSVERKIRIGGELYQVERLALLKDGAVAIVREASRYGGDEEFSDFRMSMGIQPSVSKPEEWEQVWDGHMLHYRNPIMTLLEDSERGVVYFPDALSDEGRPRFTVRGLRARDGQWVAGFPANFQVEFDSKGKWAGVRITGTAVDFKHNRLYIHDAGKNRLLAAELRLKN